MSLMFLRRNCERVHVEGVGHFVHVRLAGEVVGGGGESAIGALAKGRPGGMELDELVVNVVGSADGGGAGIVVVILPGGEGAVAAHAGFDFDEAGGAEIGPGEFFFAGPDDFDRLAGGFGKARGFDGGLAAVLATVAAAHVGLDDAHFFR